MGSRDAYVLAGHPALLRYMVAVALVLFVYVLGAAAGDLVDSGSQFLLLATAVMASAWFAGIGPGLAATVTGALLGAVQAPEPSLLARGAHMHLALFTIHALLLTALVCELRRARETAERQAAGATAARRESETAARLKDEFLATISHELRTPLNAVLGWVHLLQTGKLDPVTTRRGLECIDRNIRLQAQLTGDLLDTSKTLTGALELDSRPVCLVEVVRQAIDAARPAASARHVRITSELPRSPIAVLGDPTRLRQIAWQLLTNAVKFTPGGGLVDVRVEAAGNSAILMVADSGPGVPVEFLPRLFERFTQADSSTTRAAGGLGVGLSLVRDLVEMHGGDILASNSPEYGGALFRVRLPRQDAASPKPYVPVADAPPLGPPPALDGVRVLVLDQDADGRDLVSTLLQRQGASVQTAASVAEALEALEAWRPDVLVTDSVASDHATYALVGKVRTLEANRGGRIPALALTAAARRDRDVGQMLAAVQCDLPKPLEPAVLAAEIARLSGRVSHPRQQAH
jgi:signal transduction histidine kinase/CheY-like chemotaxis protein